MVNGETFGAAAALEVLKLLVPSSCLKPTGEHMLPSRRGRCRKELAKQPGTFDPISTLTKLLG